MKNERTQHEHITFNRKEHDALCAKAKQCGLSLSAYLRRLVLDKTVEVRPTEVVRVLYVEINRIGNNINQIACSVNSGIATAEDARQALFLLGRCMRSWTR